MKKLTKWTLVIHRYLGLGLSVLFVMWFLSGLVMMYATYPTMRQHQRLQQLPILRFDACRISPEQALRKAGIADTIKVIRLGMLLDRPVYRMMLKTKPPVVVFADNGEVAGPVDTSLAKAIAGAFIKHTSKVVRIETLTEIDQWMAAHKSQGYLPLVHRLEMNDAAGTYLYVSIHTGEVVQMVNARQRFWAWLGPIPHWLYPTVLIRNRAVWSQVVIWVSLLGTVMCLAGMIIGIIRIKRKKADTWAFSPYKKKWFRWHHYTGFAFGLFVFTWILSGLFSMSPLNWAPSTRLSEGEANQWTDGPLNPALFRLSPAKAAQLLQATLAVKEIQLTQLHGKPYYLGYQDDYHSALLAADRPGSKPFQRVAVQPLLVEIQQLKPSVRILEDSVLTAYDDYYYDRHHDKRLPVLRVKMDDPAQTWYYVDLKTGHIALKHQSASRLERWLYHGLHSLDFRFLVFKRPLWDIVMICLLLGGLVVSSTGLALTWKWGKRKLGQPRHRKTKITRKTRSANSIRPNSLNLVPHTLGKDKR